MAASAHKKFKKRLFFMSSLDSTERFRAFEESISTQLSMAEEELSSLTKPQSLSKHSSSSNINTISWVSRASTCSKDNSASPQWDQIITLAKSGQEEEAFFQLIRVVQRLLDEKANAKAVQEKAAKAYVDNLFERVSTGVKDNLLKYAEDSCESLEGQVILLQQKIGEVKTFFQNEMREIKLLVAALKETDDQTETIETSRSSEANVSSRLKPGSSFTVCPQRQPR